MFAGNFLITIKKFLHAYFILPIKMPFSGHFNDLNTKKDTLEMLRAERRLKIGYFIPSKHLRKQADEAVSLIRCIQV